MPDADPLILLIEQAKRIAAHHPELAEAYVAAIREKARGMDPKVLDELLGDLAKPSAPSRT